MSAVLCETTVRWASQGIQGKVDFETKRKERKMNIGFVVILLFGLLVTIIKWGLIIWGIVWLVRYLKRSREERQRLRIELGKLAEEVRLMRQELKEGKDSDTSAQ